MPGFRGFKQLLWTSNDFNIEFGEIITYHGIDIYCIQHCMDLQLAVDPYKRRVLFESMD